MARRKVVPKRGEVYLVRFDPTVGHEIKKTRPALVVQNDISNEASRTTIVAPITSQIGPEVYPFEVLIPAKEAGLEKEFVAVCTQIRTIDRKRLGKRLGTVRAEIMAQADRALSITLGLVNL